MISTHAFTTNYLVCVYLISPLYLVECLFTIQKPLTQVLFRSFLTGYGPRTYLTCRFENEMSNSTLREVNHIAKFNGTNFSLWKFGTWLLLEQHNLVGIVMFKHIFQQMSKIFPFYFIQNEGNMLNVDDVEARMDWQRRDVLARNYLVSTIESQQQRSLINCRTANEMWRRLSAQHLRNAVENQHVLQQRFFEYQYQPDHDIMTHITEVETMASQLSDVEAPVSDIQIMTKILCTLPPSY